MLTILVVEDDPAIREMLRTFLSARNFHVEEADSGQAAYDWLAEKNPDLIVLDWMLPGFSGQELLKMMRANPAQKEIPVIMLTARAEERDKIAGLETGADDYLVKPFSLQELNARIGALLRRSQRLDENARIEVGPLSLDPHNRVLYINDDRIDIAPTEFRLLHYLMRTPGRLHSRAQLLDRVWGQGQFIEERTVDVHILRLRKLLKKAGVDDVVETVRGAGYRLKDSGSG